MVNKTRYNNFNKALDHIEKAVKNKSWITLSRAKFGSVLRLRDANDYVKLFIVYDPCSNKIHMSFVAKHMLDCYDGVIKDIKDASTLKEYISKIIQFSEIGKVVTMIHNINIEKTLDGLDKCE